MSFSWSSTSKQETAASVAAREAYQATNHPIGEASELPETIYETITKSGVYSSSALDNGINVLLPAYWSDGELLLEDNSFFWLSKEQYDSLIGSKTATLSLGLFDEKLSSMVKISDNVQNALNSLKQNSEKAAQSQDIYKLTAAADWKTYSLIIDGAEKTVRTIEASNWFGSYVILANSENPLIIKATLNPFAVGSIEISSPLSSFLGYEVTEIKIK